MQLSADSVERDSGPRRCWGEEAGSLGGRDGAETQQCRCARIGGLAGPHCRHLRDRCPKRSIVLPQNLDQAVATTEIWRRKLDHVRMQFMRSSVARWPEAGRPSGGCEREKAQTVAEMNFGQPVLTAASGGAWNVACVWFSRHRAPQQNRLRVAGASGHRRPRQARTPTLPRRHATQRRPPRQLNTPARRGPPLPLWAPARLCCAVSAA